MRKYYMSRSLFQTSLMVSGAVACMDVFEQNYLITWESRWNKRDQMCKSTSKERRAQRHMPISQESKTMVYRAGKIGVDKTRERRISSQVKKWDTIRDHTPKHREKITWSEGAFRMHCVEYLNIRKIVWRVMCHKLQLFHTKTPHFYSSAKILHVHPSLMSGRCVSVSSGLRHCDHC